MKAQGIVNVEDPSLPGYSSDDPHALGDIENQRRIDNEPTRQKSERVRRDGSRRGDDRIMDETRVPSKSKSKASRRERDGDRERRREDRSRERDRDPEMRDSDRRERRRERDERERRQDNQTRQTEGQSTYR